uniref:Secreted phosphoprotein 1 n=1 Tax=Denticeps clupeoides TaxID=299321 RepID=A0AAY4CI16_9TELE
ILRRVPQLLVKAAPVLVTFYCSLQTSLHCSNEFIKKCLDCVQDSEESSESGESTITTPSAPTTEPIIEAITVYITDDAGRGDSMGYNDYKKSIMYAESNHIEKVPAPYKSYDDAKTGLEMNLVSKKMAMPDSQDGNEVEKNLKVYKALQVHGDVTDGDTSTPEVDSLGLDASSGVSGEPSQDKAASDSQSTQEADGGTTSADSDGTSESGSQEQSDSSQSSEETKPTSTATPDSDDDSSQSSESEENPSDTTTETPVVVMVK